MVDRLLPLARSVLLPGFAGATPPEWIRRRLGEGLNGVVLFSRNVIDPVQVSELTAALRAERSDVIVGVDEEGGEVTRLEVGTGSSLPGNFALGQVDDIELTGRLAQELGRWLAGLGITINFAPSVDINSNPENPVIGLRSFGADPDLVARHGAAWVRGLQGGGVAACVKHFPGHGDTAVDSHHATPVVDGDPEALRRTLLPFRTAIEAGAGAVMTGHLLVPTFDPALPATLSRKILSGLLRERLGFEGLIVTDAIEMAAVAGARGIGGAAALAVDAGADAICVGGERFDELAVDEIAGALVEAVTTRRLAEERLAEAARRVAAFARRPAPSPDPPSPRPSALTGIGLAAARRAVDVTGAGLPLPTGACVVELEPELNLAIDRKTSWGVGSHLAALVEDTATYRVDEAGARCGTLQKLLAAAADRPFVVVVRDAHRIPWQADALDELLAGRPDAVIVDMGLPGGAPRGAVYLATHGSSRVCGQAAAEILAGRAPAGGGR